MFTIQATNETWNLENKTNYSGRESNPDKRSRSGQNGADPAKMERIQTKRSGSGQKGADPDKKERIREKRSGSGQKGADPDNRSLDKTNFNIWGRAAVESSLLENVLCYPKMATLWRVLPVLRKLQRKNLSFYSLNL